MVLMKKKDGSWHFCVDYRKLKDPYPLSRMDDVLELMRGAECFASLNPAGRGIRGRLG